MYVYTLDSEDIQKNANVIKEVILKGLEHEGYIKSGDATKIGELYAIVLHKKGWFGEWFDKHFLGIKEGSFRISFVKIVS